MTEIEEKIIDAITDGARDNLNIHMPTILEVYAREGGVSVSMKATMKPGKNGNMQILSGIEFVESKVKDENLRVVETKQLGLFSDEPKHHRLGGSGIDSMTISSGGKSVTLDKAGIDRLDKAIEKGGRKQ